MGVKTAAMTPPLYLARLAQEYAFPSLSIDGEK